MNKNSNFLADDEEYLEKYSHYENLDELNQTITNIANQFKKHLQKTTKM